MTKGRISFNLDYDRNTDNVTLPDTLDTFYSDIRDSTDFGFKFTDCIQVPDTGKYHFKIEIYLYNGQPPQPPQPPQLFAIYELTLEHFLSLPVHRDILLIRFLADILKDAVVATKNVPITAARDILKKIVPEVFPDALLQQTLDTLLHEFKSDWSLETPDSSPSAGEILTSILSDEHRDGVRFNLPDGQRSDVKVIYRDSGPKANLVVTTCNPLEQDQRLGLASNMKTQIQALLDGGVANPIFHNTAGNYLDPANNPPAGRLFSPVFVDFEQLFLTKFNGMSPANTAATPSSSINMALKTTRLDDTIFNCHVDIRYRNNHMSNLVVAEFLNLYCNMRSLPTNGGIGEHSGSQQVNVGNIIHSVRNLPPPPPPPPHAITMHKYSNVRGGQDDIMNGTTKEFVSGIAGNNEKNAFLLNFTNKPFLLNQKAQALSKIILKSMGDPNQLLFITAEILYYALKRLQSAVIQQRQPQTLCHFFKDTMKKYLLITCDGVLARLAVGFKFPVALQIGNSLAHITFNPTDEESQQKCAFITKKETLKRNMDKYALLLAKCNGRMNTCIVFSDETCEVNSNIQTWTNFNLNKNLLGRAIKHHYGIIDALVYTNNYVNDVRLIEDLYTKPLVIKTQKNISNGNSVIIYYLNYLQSLEILINYVNAEETEIDNVTKFIFFTTNTRSEDSAKNHQDYKKYFHSDDDESLPEEDQNDQPPAGDQNDQQPDEEQHLQPPVLPNQEQIRQQQKKAKLEKLAGHSKQRNNYNLRIRKQLQDNLTQGGGGNKSNKQHIQIGGCQYPDVNIPPRINFDKIFGEQWNLETEQPVPEGSISINLCGNRLFIDDDTPAKCYLRVLLEHIPYVQLCTFVLFAKMLQHMEGYMINVLSYIAGENIEPESRKKTREGDDSGEDDGQDKVNETGIITMTLYDLIFEYVLKLRMKDEENTNSRREQVEQQPPPPPPPNMADLVDPINKLINIICTINDHIENKMTIVAYASSNIHLIVRLFEIIFRNQASQMFLFGVCRLIHGGDELSQFRKNPEISLESTTIKAAESLSVEREYVVNLIKTRNGGYSESPVRQAADSFEKVIPDSVPLPVQSNRNDKTQPELLSTEESGADSDEEPNNGMSAQLLSSQGQPPPIIQPTFNFETVLEQFDMLKQIGSEINKASTTLPEGDQKDTSIFSDLSRLIVIVGKKNLDIDCEGCDINSLIINILSKSSLYIQQQLYRADNLIAAAAVDEAAVAVDEAAVDEADRAAVEAAAAAARAEASRAKAARAAAEAAAAIAAREAAGEAAIAAARAAGEAARSAGEAARSAGEAAAAAAVARLQIKKIINKSETAIFIDYLCLCCETLCNYIYEFFLSKDGQIGELTNFQFTINEAVSDENRVEGSASPNATKVRYIRPRIDTPPPPSIAHSGGVAGGGFGSGVNPLILFAGQFAGSSAKKSTHRKHRRHTRNYQSYNNKRKHRSSKKSTIKHRKSYRKHNRTIKRRKNSRRHHQ